MTLSEFMTARGLRDDDLVECLGVGRSMVTKLRLRSAKPSFDVASRMIAMSDGLISVADMMPMRPAPQPEAAA